MGGEEIRVAGLGARTRAGRVVCEADGALVLGDGVDGSGALKVWGAAEAVGSASRGT